MIREMMFCLLVPGAVALAGCRHASPATVDMLRSAPPLGPLVGRDELLGTGRPLLLDALRVARPTYFASRGPATLVEGGTSPMVVVIDGLVLPDIDALRATPVSDVVSVRRLSVAETFFRYRRSVSVGALEIVLRK